MNCLDKTDLVKYLKGELAQEQYQEIKKHIDVCEGCAKKLSALTTLMKLDHILYYEKEKGYAGECISKFRLLQYVVKSVNDKVVKSANDKAITRHVFHCSNCKRKYFSYLQRYESLQACFEKLKTELANRKLACQMMLEEPKKLLEIIFLPPTQTPVLAPAVRRVMRGGTTLPVFTVEEVISESPEEITDKDLAEKIIKETAKEEFTRAACYEQLGLYQEALDLYEKLDPKNEDEIMLGRKIVLYRKLRKHEDDVEKLEERYKKIMGLQE